MNDIGQILIVSQYLLKETNIPHYYIQATLLLWKFAGLWKKLETAAISRNIKIWPDAINKNLTVLWTFQYIVLHENMKKPECLFPKWQSLQSYEKFVYRICLKAIKLLSVEKGCLVAIYFVCISLATMTSSKVNVKNSAKAWYVDEIDSYRFLKFETNQSNQRILWKQC